MHALALLVSLVAPQSLVLDADVGWPSLESSEFRLAGGLALGWETESWSIVASGHASFYDLGGGDDPVTQQSLSLRGALDGGYLTGEPTSFVRFEVLGSVGGALYDADTLGAAGMPLDDQSSVLGRGSVLLGVRLRPIAQLQLNLRAGGGLQYEFFDYLRVGAGTAELSDNEQLTFRVQARLFARFSVVPGTVSVRLLWELDRFELTRDTSSLTVGPSSQANLQFDVARAQSTQLEIRSKLFVGLDMLSFSGFLPAVFGGVQLIETSGGGADTSAVVPVFGIGLFSDLDA